MKTKEKEIQKKIKELCELMDEDEKFFFFRKKGNAVNIALPSASERNDDRVSAALSSVIESHFLEKVDEGVDRLSEIIVNSIEALIGISFGWRKAYVAVRKGCVDWYENDIG